MNIRNLFAIIILHSLSNHLMRMVEAHECIRHSIKRWNERAPFRECIWIDIVWRISSSTCDIRYGICVCVCGRESWLFFKFLCVVHCFFCRLSQCFVAAHKDYSRAVCSFFRSLALSLSLLGFASFIRYLCDSYYSVYEWWVCVCFFSALDFCSSNASIIYLRIYPTFNRIWSVTLMQLYVCVVLYPRFTLSFCLWGVGEWVSDFCCCYCCCSLTLPFLIPIKKFNCLHTLSHFPNDC